MIEKLLANSRTTEIDALLIRILGTYPKTTLNTDAYLASVMLLIEENSKQLNRAVNRMKVASELKEKDEVRDNALRSFYYLVQGFLHHPDKAISVEAKKLMAVLNHYGLEITKESYATESSLISSLLIDLGNADLQASIAKLSGCAELIAALRTAEDIFEATRLQYDENKAGEGTLSSATNLKREAVKLINTKLVVYLRAMIQVNEEMYGAFARTVAEIIASNNVAVKKRSKKYDAE